MSKTYNGQSHSYCSYLYGKKSIFPQSREKLITNKTATFARFVSLTRFLLAAPLISEWNHLRNFGSVSRRTILLNYFEFRPGFQEEMSFKDIAYLKLWQPLCSMEWNHFYNFDRVHQEEQFCAIILNLDQCFRRRCNLKTFVRALTAPLFMGPEPFV